MDRVADGGGGVMVWEGVCYGQRTQLHFIDGILNAQRYRDERRERVELPDSLMNEAVLQSAGPRLETPQSPP